MDDVMIGDSPGPSAGAEGESLRLSASEWGLLLVLASMQFTHIVDFMIIMPLGPQLMRKLEIGPQQFGLVVSSYTIAAGLAGLVASSLVYRLGHGSLLVMGGTLQHHWLQAVPKAPGAEG